MHGTSVGVSDSLAGGASLASVTSPCYRLVEGEHPVSVAEYVSARVRAVQTRPTAFRLVQEVTVVNHRPGADTSGCAREFASAYREMAASWNTQAVWPSAPGSLPAVFTLVDRKALERAGRETGLLSATLAERLLSAPALAVAALVLAVLLSFWLEPSVPGGAPLANFIATVSRGDTYLNAAILAGVLLGARGLWTTARDPRGVRRLRRLQDALMAGAADASLAMSEACARLVQDIEKPGAIIVPSYESLDPLSRSALRRALETPSMRDMGVIQWVVFEPERYEGLMGDLARAAEVGGCVTQNLTLRAGGQDGEPVRAAA